MNADNMITRPVRLLAILMACVVFSSLHAAVWQWSVPDGSARAYLWIPEDCQRVRGVVLANHNMVEQGILEHPAMRGTLARLGFAEIWLVPYLDATFDFNQGAGEHFQHVVDSLAEKSGYTELRTAPVVPLGHSACATFPWNFAAWAPSRTVALISYHGDAPRTTLTGNGKPRIEWGDRTIDGIPALMVMGQYEWWEDRLAPAFDFMAAHPKAPIAFLADAGRGHFDYADRTVAFLAAFIEKAAAARLPADGSTGPLRPVDPRNGWRIDRWHPDVPPSAPAAPHARYSGDPLSAFWCFDEAMARDTETIYAGQRGKLPQLLSVTDGQTPLEQGNGEPVRPRFLPDADGITFRLHTDFLDRVPGNSPKGALWTGLPVGTPLGHSTDGGPITLSRIVGPFVQLSPDTFQLSFGRAEYTANHRNHDLWLVAAQPGNASYRSIVQQAVVRVAPNTLGAPQTITFPALPDQPAGTSALKLTATADSGLPVSYYVLEGPAEIDGNTLRFTTLPPRSRLPVTVTVIAWQFGRATEPRVMTATPVERSFTLLPAASAQAVNAFPEPRDSVRILDTVTDGFVHPGIGLTKDILENARKQILARKDPWYSGFIRLAGSPPASKTATCRNESRRHPGEPDLDAFDNKGAESRLKGDASKAKLQALMYYFTGDEVYRANAMNIVRVWSRMDPSKYKAYPECYIHASYPVQDLIVAAELLRYTSARDPKLAWNAQDTKDFTANFAVPAVNTFLNENGWFMNQNGYPLAAAMSGDIFTNNRESYAKRVEWFTVNKTAPNKGWSSSIQDLARLVDTNALTGEKAPTPVVQLMEMGRDQAHAGDDVEIFMNTARQMNAQGTRVDPTTGTLSTAADAVGPYEFLHDRILAAADQFCRFMLGYDTPWIPAPSDIGPDGEVRKIYPRIADNYRGRIRGLDCWDAYYYYACQKSINVADKAPYYHEAFTKRIVASTVDWIYIPEGVTGEGAKVAPTEQEPAVIEIALRSTAFDDKAVVMREGDTAFVRVTPSQAGTRIAILSSDTNQKTIGLRIRTNGVAEVAMSGFKTPWLLPDTQGEWRYVTYPVGTLEHFRDIEFFSVKGSPGITVDFSTLIRNGAENLTPPVFRSGEKNALFVTYVGAPVKLDFAATGKGNPIITSPDKPHDSVLDVATGRFSWTPSREGDHTFVVNATDGETVDVKRVHIIVTRDRKTAVKQIVSALTPDTPYVSATLKNYQSALGRLNALGRKADDDTFLAQLRQLHEAADALEPLTPRLTDGSIDFPGIVASSTINASIALLTDGNDDTFPVYTLAKNLGYVFDFGPRFKLSATAFALEGRLNFEDRATDTAFFGSNDGTTWTQLTVPIKGLPVELTKVAVKPELVRESFRYLKLQKGGAPQGGLFEPAELRIYGQRHETR
jgi:hypothetical protein